MTSKEFNKAINKGKQGKTKLQTTNISKCGRSECGICDILVEEEKFQLRNRQMFKDKTNMDIFQQEFIVYPKKVKVVA